MDEYLAKSWINPSWSPWGAPIIFIRKKTTELRMTVDYHALNRYVRVEILQYNFLVMKYFHILSILF